MLAERFARIEWTDWNEATHRFEKYEEYVSTYPALYARVAELKEQGQQPRFDLTEEGRDEIRGR